MREEVNGQCSQEPSEPRERRPTAVARHLIVRGIGWQVLTPAGQAIPKITSSVPSCRASLAGRPPNATRSEPECGRDIP